jgi:hypothetical protein
LNADTPKNLHHENPPKFTASSDLATGSLLAHHGALTSIGNLTKYYDLRIINTAAFYLTHKGFFLSGGAGIRCACGVIEFGNRVFPFIRKKIILN